MSQTPGTKTKDELLAAKAAREAKLEQEGEAHDLLLLQLEDRFSEELGPRGVEWEFVNENNSSGAGPLVVKKGTAVQSKTFQAALEKDKGSKFETFFAYVTPLVVYPDLETFKRLGVERPHLVYRAAQAVTSLYGAAFEERSGKY